MVVSPCLSGRWSGDRVAECGGLENRCAPGAPGVRIPPAPPLRGRPAGRPLTVCGGGPRARPVGGSGRDRSRPRFARRGSWPVGFPCSLMRAAHPSTEMSHSGLVRFPAKKVGDKTPRGFESPHLRHTLGAQREPPPRWTACHAGRQVRDAVPVLRGVPPAPSSSPSAGPVRRLTGRGFVAVGRRG